MFVKVILTIYGIATFLALMVVALGIIKALNEVSHKNIGWINITISIIIIILIVFLPIIHLATLISILWSFEDFANTVEFGIREDHVFISFF